MRYILIDKHIFFSYPKIISESEYHWPASGHETIICILLVL